MEFCSVQNLDQSKSKGQSTIEFALVAPLVVGCAIVLVSITVVCLQLIQLHDLVRATTRVAVTTNDPTQYARDVATQLNLDISVDDDLVTGLVTIRATRQTKVPLWGGVSKLLGLEATVTMMRESPPVLTR